MCPILPFWQEPATWRSAADAERVSFYRRTTGHFDYEQEICEDCTQTSLRIFNEVYSGFQHLIATGCDALDRGLDDNVGDYAETLGRPVIGIEDAEAADQGAELPRKPDKGNVAVCTGRGTADYDGVGHRA